MIFIIITLLKILSIVIPSLIAVAYFTIAERKIMGAIQRRRGPNVIDFIGLLQPLADGLKLFIKETITIVSNRHYYAPHEIICEMVLSIRSMTNGSIGNLYISHHADGSLHMFSKMTSLPEYRNLTFANRKFSKTFQTRRSYNTYNVLSLSMKILFGLGLGILGCLLVVVNGRELRLELLSDRDKIINSLRLIHELALSNTSMLKITAINLPDPQDLVAVKLSFHYGFSYEESKLIVWQSMKSNKYDLVELCVSDCVLNKIHADSDSLLNYSKVSNEQQEMLQQFDSPR